MAERIRKKGLTNARRNSLIGLSFLSLWIVGFLLFTLYPIILSLYFSFNRIIMGVNGTEYEFVGLEFFNRAFNVDTEFTPKLVESFAFIAYATPIIVIVALILALMLNRSFSGRTLFRAIFFMPVVIMSGPVISELLGKYSVDFSVATPSLFSFIDSLPQIFRSPCMFVLENLVTVLWYSGVQILILLIVIQSISPELYEAASIDGASSWEKFWKITLPYVAPTAMLCALYTIVELANDSTNSVNTYISQKMFDSKVGYYSYSTVMSWLYTVVIILMILIVFLLFGLFRRKEKR